MASTHGLRWLNELGLEQVERLGLVDQSLALLTTLAQAEAQSLVPCYRGHRLLRLLPYLHEAWHRHPTWPALGGKASEAVLLSEAPAAPPAAAPQLLRTATAMSATWSHAAQELRQVAGRLTVHGEELRRSCQQHMAMIQVAMAGLLKEI